MLRSGSDIGKTVVSRFLYLYFAVNITYYIKLFCTLPAITSRAMTPSDTRAVLDADVQSNGTGKLSHMRTEYE